MLENDEEKDSYLEAKKDLEELLDSLKNEDYRASIYYAQTYVIPRVKNLAEARFFLDMLSQVFEDMVNIKHNKEPVLKNYDTILRELSKKLPHLEESLLEILKNRNLLNLNVNVSLLLDNLILKIIKED